MHCRRPVAILSVNSIIVALDESGNLGCSYVENWYSLHFHEVEEIKKVRYWYKMNKFWRDIYR